MLAPDPKRPRSIEREWMLAIFFAALAIRLAYTLFIHPPDDYIFSDMSSYWNWSERWLKEPLKVSVRAPFYPFGTSWILAGLKLLSGGSRVALLLLWALLGALVPPILMATTARLSGSKGAGLLCGFIAAFYYPLISFTGYFLSEMPFTLFLALALLFTLRLADTGRIRDAVGLGFAIGLGSWCRPQILLAVPILFVFWLTRVRALPKVSFWRLLPLGLTIVACLGVHAKFAHYHTGKWSIVAQNGATNRLFARCHNSVLKARGSWFGLPPFGALEKLQKRHPGFPIRVNPVRGREVTVPYRLWNEEKIHEVADQCMKESGWATQLRNAGTDVLLLWAFNTTWPDVTRRGNRAWSSVHNHLNLYILLPPCLIAMFFWGLRRNEERLGLLAVYMWVVMGTAAAYIGGTRVRTPFDTVMLVMAITMYWWFFGWLARKIGGWWRRRRERKVAAVMASPVAGGAV